MKTMFLMIVGIITFAGFFNTVQSFSEDGFDTGRFSDFHYGEKFYQYKYYPIDALVEDSSNRCYFTSDFILDKNPISESGYVKYKFPNNMNWPGGYDNSTYYIISSPSFNFPEDNRFEKIIPTKTEDGSIILEFDLMPGLNTFLANSTAFWDSQSSQIIDCLNPFDFEKQDSEYYDLVYPLKVQQNRAMMFDLNENDFLCKSEYVLILKYDGSPACAKYETVPKLIARGWGTSDNWIKISNANTAIHYEIDGTKITSVEAFSEYKNPSLPGETKQTWLKINLESKQNGTLQIILPRNLIDSKIGNSNDGFFILLDGVETEYLETKTEYERTLEFSFTSETDIVEIVGYGYYNSELSTFDGEYLSELDKQCNIDKPGSKWNDAEQLCVYANTATVCGHKIYDSKLIHNKENKYCIPADEGLSDQCHSLEEIVFGDARRDWMLYPGGAGWIPPDDSELTRIYKEVEFGMRPLNFTAMLDDEIFVNKCESNGGTWNYAYHDCEGLREVCKGAGGINVEEDVAPYCDPLVGCDASKLVRVSCVFEYENLDSNLYGFEPFRQ